MLGSTVLDTAIGLAYVYLLLSLVCTVLNEWIAGVFAMRAKTLESSIRNLLNDPNRTGLAQRLLSHPLIGGLAPPGKTPSYISARLFAAALLDTLAPATGTGPQPLWSVRQAVADLPDGQLRQTLLVLLQHAGGDLAMARQNIENWFNDAMDRVSGWYKRRAQVIVICLALLVCILLNADTFMIATGISRDPTLRAAIVATAQKASVDTAAAGTQPLTQAARLQGELQQLTLPIGWSLGPRAQATPAPPNPRGLPDSPLGWLTKLFGLAFTAVAISLGAPFWFDVLSMTLRAAGRKPAS